MQSGIVVTVNDYERLMGLIELGPLKQKSPEIAGRLQRSLLDAKILP